jgi:hypothetical protein
MKEVDFLTEIKFLRRGNDKNVETESWIIICFLSYFFRYYLDYIIKMRYLINIFIEIYIFYKVVSKKF